MRLQDFLFESVDLLRAGDLLRLDKLQPMLEMARDQIETWSNQIEDDPQPPGLEALDDAILEALDYFTEAIDYLELAVGEHLPELADLVSARTQDALDTLRHVNKQAQTQGQMLANETQLLGEQN